MVQQIRTYHSGYEYLKGNNPPYWHIDRPLTVYRIPTWINWQYNISGLLYWTTVVNLSNPWTNPEFGATSRMNGGGYLLYPGAPCGIDGPVACMRLKNLRDGMDDYEYLAILKDLAGKEAVDEIVNTIAPNWWDFSKNPGDFIDAREKLANEILKAKK
ncbi:unnamed protein product [marine sediment metagenome]|uniref:Glycoside hydrolase 123 catalytic domain-containing protein n=1 Tax=marine sediment metagenome TaxID=412755 RepID=X0SZH3_9ZZZZ